MLFYFSCDRNFFRCLDYARYGRFKLLAMAVVNWYIITIYYVRVQCGIDVWAGRLSWCVQGRVESGM